MKRDPLTKEEFLPKSISQRFATPENRIKYHNLKAKALRHSSAFVNKPLHQNLMILERLLSDALEVKVHKEFLLGKGFSFNVHTHYEEYEGKNRFAMYNFMVIPLEKEQIKIIKIN